MKIQLQREFYLPDYEAEKNRCIDFITQFADPSIPRDQEHPLHGKLKYMIQLQGVANKQAHVIEIEIEDLKDFFSSAKDIGFVERIKTNTSRYISIFSQVIDQHMPQPSIELRDEDFSSFDIVMQQRRFNAATAHQRMVASGVIKAAETGTTQKLGIPPELERQYHLQIVPGANAKEQFVKMREIKANSVGSLVMVKGIVTRCSDIKPCMQVAVYACDACGCEVYQVVSQKQFMPLIECKADKCTKNQVKGQLVLQVKQSKFVSFQEIKIQEPSDQVPIGHVPRQLTVVAKGPTTRQCSPGDIVQVTGVYLPAQATGFEALRAGLAHQTHVEACKIVKDKQNFKEHMLSEKMLEMVNEVKDATNSEKELFECMANSICPEIFGMEEVKQALLLLMIGGVTKEMKDGMRIRGHLNALLMGDPGVAKSQLLKFISRFAPRGIYTTGKGSSGVGLTAAVMKDASTGEVVLEGGALVLADTGVCCIDEFDKMDERDRTNIHEVMEQQTISIAKAGITTTLNARTSILAAANPVYGRYNKKLKPHENINLPAALLSRFDIIFLLLDTANDEMDKKLARHVTQVHQTMGAPPADSKARVDSEVMRSFIAHAQSYNPIIPADLHNYIVARYVEKRKFQREGKEEVSYMYITPRTLLAIIRISQAMAKFHFRNEVTQQDVDHAIKIMDVSFRTLENIADGGDKKLRRKNESMQDVASQVISDIRTLFSQANARQMNTVEIFKKLQRMDPTKYSQKAFKRDNLLDVLNFYSKNLQVVYVDPEENVVFL